MQAAVIMFKSAYTLEMTRRVSDKKIMALYVEMKDMMEIIVQCAPFSATRLCETALTLTRAKVPTHTTRH